MLRFEIVSQLIPESLIEVKKELETAMKQAAGCNHRGPRYGTGTTGLHSANERSRTGHQYARRGTRK